MKERAKYSSHEQKSRVSKVRVLNAILEVPSLLMSHFTVLETEAQRAEVAKLSLLEKEGCWIRALKDAQDFAWCRRGGYLDS